MGHVDAFVIFEGIAAPLRRTNVDTDQIIPSRFMKRITKSGYGDGLFAAWREDPSFVLNQPRYEGCSVLVVGENFGCGSSREHAVWALRDYGIRAVLGQSFADIFAGNAASQGLLAAQVKESDLEDLYGLAEDASQARLTIDLENRCVRGDAFSCGFTVDDHVRRRLLAGLDDIDETLSHERSILEYEQGRPSWMPHTIPFIERNSGGEHAPSPPLAQARMETAPEERGHPLAHRIDRTSA